MHLHTHLVDCVLDYGLVSAFWLFSFERYNGILGEFGMDQQLMRTFTSIQFVQDVPLPTVFQDVLKPVLDKLVSNQARSLQDQSLEQDNLSARVIHTCPSFHWSSTKRNWLCMYRFFVHMLWILFKRLYRCWCSAWSYKMLQDSFGRSGINLHYNSLWEVWIL